MLRWHIGDYTRLSTGKERFDSATECYVRVVHAGRAPDFQSGFRGFNSCHVHLGVGEMETALVATQFKRFDSANALRLLSSMAEQLFCKQPMRVRFSQ